MSHPRGSYAREAERLGAEVAALELRRGRIEVARLGSFVVAAVAGLLRNDLPVSPAWPLTLFVFAAVAFVVLVVRHRRLRRRLARAKAAEALARMGRARLERDWAQLALIREEIGYDDPLLRPGAARNEEHPYTSDLDLFGPASIRALLGPTPTPTGVERLRGWFSYPSAPADITERQQAVLALAGEPALREALAVESLLVDPADGHAWERFLAWTRLPPVFGHAAEGRPTDGLPTWALWVARLLPPVTLTLFALWVPARVPGWSWLLPLGIQVALGWRWAQSLREYFELAAGRSPGIRRHHGLFAAWEACPVDQPTVRRLVGRLTDGDGRTASASIRSLERLLDLVESRASMFQFLFSAGLLSDVHLAWALERWRGRSAERVEGWFDALGELEALSALATLAHDQPAWSMPEVRTTGEPGFEARGLGHPLLADDVRRTSDVRVDEPGRFLLVTGSNMSGKSTLLRSIGLAAVMGQAGCVVCAAEARMSPLRVFTSMRIHDSITGGVSLFMAELLRLKQLVDAADADGPALLYLVDEVLQGTNSEERRVAARRIIAHLLEAHAIGAVTTHDLALHEDPLLDPRSTKVHFRETVSEGGGDVLSFDYLLRPGLATSRNALKLLRIVGLDGGDRPETTRESGHPGPEPRD